MICIKSSHCSSLWVQVHKASIEFIGLHDHPRSFAKAVIGARFAHDAANKSCRILARNGQNVQQHSRSARLAVGSSDGETAGRIGQQSQCFRALDHPKVFEKLQPSQIFRHRRGVNDCRLLSRPTRVVLCIVFVGNNRTLCGQFVRQLRAHLVVAKNRHTFVQIMARNGTHADPANA
ncbi:MAG: Uncharacterised protein [Cryomorphaceae bacterium]|nr:MAG: Uncharacterised protein [Cryomorphaceae bacterium]